MEWSGKYQLTIITVIHTNYGTDKATGHLGSALMKKCESCIDLKPTEGGVVDVTCKQSRNFSFEDFSFEVTESGLPKVINHPI